MALSLESCYFFGTFNPIHMGHLMMAEWVRSRFGFQTVLFIPAANPPHRLQDKNLAPFKHRLAMVQLACEDNPGFLVSDIEGRREGPSYTVDTLTELVPGFGTTRQEKTPVIIGADALADLATWHQADVLARHCCFLQAPRVKLPPQQCVTLNGQEYPLSIQPIDMPVIGISSTLIRRRLLDELSIRYLVHDRVREYLDDCGLYR